MGKISLLMGLEINVAYLAKFYEKQYRMRLFKLTPGGLEWERGRNQRKPGVRR